MNIPSSNNRLQYDLRGCRLKNHRRGTAVVQMALVLPILVTFIFASIEFARLNIIRHVAANASYEGCRHVIVPGGTAAEAQTTANQIMSAIGVSNVTVTVTPNPILETTGTISVKVDVPAKGNLWFVPVFSAGKTISAETTLLAERPPQVQTQALGS